MATGYRSTTGYRAAIPYQGRLTVPGDVVGTGRGGTVAAGSHDHGGGMLVVCGGGGGGQCSGSRGGSVGVLGTGTGGTAATGLRKATGNVLGTCLSSQVIAGHRGADNIGTGRGTTIASGARANVGAAVATGKGYGSATGEAFVPGRGGRTTSWIGGGKKITGSGNGYGRGECSMHGTAGPARSHNNRIPRPPVHKSTSTHGSKRQRVQSSAVRSVGYNSDTRVLEVEFSNGSVYHYHASQEDYDALMEAESPGSFLRSRIFPRSRGRLVSS